MVFQSYALYPHKTVAENMGFPLKMAKRPKAEIDEKVGRAAEILDLTRYLDRYPKQLSADSVNAWRWVVPSSETRRSSYSTSHCRTSTPNSASLCASRSRSFTSG